MPNHKVPIAEEEIVKQRLALGASLRQSIEGTSIQSPTTASNIAKENVDEIGQIRSDYLKKIKDAGANDDARAKLWAEMTTATKLFGKNAKEHADWSNRGEALKYIDSLAGITKEKSETQPFNLFNNPIFVKQYERS